MENKTLLRIGLVLSIGPLLFQFILSDLIFVILGIGRTLHSVNNFPYQCYRIEDPRLSACEDMWLSDATRQLFLACSDPQVRSQWMPNIGRFNVSGRSTRDAIIALDVDKPITNTDTAVGTANTQRTFSYRVLHLLNFPRDPTPKNDNADSITAAASVAKSPLQLVGLTGIDSPDQINLYFVNNRPSINHATNHDADDGTISSFADNAVIGANSTVEHFITGPAATAMKHVRTYAATEGMYTPNNIAIVPGRKGFFITNDHGSSKTGLWHTLSPFVGTGDVTYCDTSSTSTTCTKIVGGLKFPNGLLYHPVHDLLYVPSAAVGNIHVYQPTFTTSGGVLVPKLTKVGVVQIPYPMDNLSLDQYTSDIYAAAFPKTLPVMAGFDDPTGKTKAPSAAIRVRKVDGQMKWEWEKVLEDQEGDVLPVSTTVVRDGKTGRLFLSGVYSPFITVCNPV